MLNKLALGTVQFGMPYGISNREGVPSKQEIKNILDVAKFHNINLLDTAPAYEQSEGVLGEVLGCEDFFQVVTKTIPNLSQFSNPSSEVKKILNMSLGQLKRKQVYGLLVHTAKDLLGPDGRSIYKALNELKEEEKVLKIGVSVYTPAEVEKILELYNIDLIQLPLNLLDQRILRSGSLEKLKENGIEVHARSIFLQGLLLMEDDRLPDFADSVKSHLKMIKKTINDRGLSMIEAALGFVYQLPMVDRIIIGVCSNHQLVQINEILNSLIKTDWITSTIRWSFANDFYWPDEKILNPSLWTTYA